MSLIYYNSKVKLKKEILEDIIDSNNDCIVFLGKRENPIVNLKHYTPVIINLDQQPYLFNGATDKKGKFYGFIEDGEVVPILYFGSERDEYKVLIKIAPYLNQQRIVYVTDKKGIYVNGQLKEEITKDELKEIIKEPNNIDEAPQLLELLKYADEIIFGKTKIVGYSSPY